MVSGRFWGPPRTSQQSLLTGGDIDLLVSPQPRERQPFVFHVKMSSTITRSVRPAGY